MSTISPTRRAARASSPWTLLDLAMACMQFRIREEDQYRTSFRVPGGQYDFRGSTFGLHGMSSVLMRFIQSIFGPYGRSALSFDATRRAQPASLVSAHGVAVDPRKVAAVTEWTALTSITDVRRFVCRPNYYPKFGLCFSSVETPLTALCSPRAEFMWGPAEQGFDALKVAQTSTPVLRVWDPALPTPHPVAFESRKLTQPERSYPPHMWSCWRWWMAQATALPPRHLAEYQHRVVYTPGRANPAPGSASPTGYDEPAAPDPAGRGKAAAHLMGRVTADVWPLMQERQERR